MRKFKVKDAKKKVILLFGDRGTELDLQDQKVIVPKDEG